MSYIFGWLGMYLTGEITLMDMMKNGSADGSIGQIISAYRLWYALSSCLAIVLVKKFPRNGIMVVIAMLALSGCVISSFHSTRFIGLILAGSIGVLNSIAQVEIVNIDSRKSSKIFARNYLFLNISGFILATSLPVIYSHNAFLGHLVVFLTFSIGATGAILFVRYCGNIKNHEAESGHLPEDGTKDSLANASFVKTLLSKKMMVVYATLLTFVLVRAGLNQMFFSFAIHSARMNLHIGDITLLPAQLPSMEPMMAAMMTPLLLLIIKKLESRGFFTTDFDKIAISSMSLIFAFIYLCITEFIVSNGIELHIAWDIILYVFTVISEMLSGIYVLQFCLSHVPTKMRMLSDSAFQMVSVLSNLVCIFLATLFPVFNTEYFAMFAVILCISTASFMVIKKVAKV